MQSRKNKRFYYKRAKFQQAFGSANITLESLLRDALGRIPKAAERFYTPHGSDSERHFINHALLHNGGESEDAVFGCELLAFDEGNSQGILSIDEDAQEIPVSALTADSGTQFLRGSVYFAVLDDHMVICQSRALRANNLENYLNWILRERVGLITEENLVMLSDHIPEQVKALMKGVTRIKLGSDLRMGTAPRDEADDRETTIAQRSTRIRPEGRVWDAIMTFLGEGLQIPTELSVDNLADTPRIHVELLLKLSRPRENNSDFLDGVASNFRHLDEDLDYELKSKSGSLKRDQVKIFRHHSISWDDESGRPRLDEFFRKTADWLAELIETGKVDP